MPHECLQQHNVPQHVIVITYFTELDTMFHSLSFRDTNIRHTKLCGLGHKQWIYQTTWPQYRTKSTACIKSRAHTRPINRNTIPQKDTMIPYMAQPRYSLYSQVLAIFFPFATIPATPHYPKFTNWHVARLRPNILASTHFLFCFEYKNPHFTILCHHMLNLAID